MTDIADNNYVSRAVLGLKSRVKMSLRLDVHSPV